VKFGGLKFLDTAHIKDMLALLRFVENPRDRVSGFRVMQLMPGVGPTSAQRVLDCMMKAADPIGALAGAPSPPWAGAVWTAFVETVTELRAAERGGRWNWSERASGMNRISTASTRIASHVMPI